MELWRGLTSLVLSASAIAFTSPFALSAFHGSGPERDAGGLKHQTGLFLAACAFGAVLPGLAYVGMKLADGRGSTVQSALVRAALAGLVAGAAWAVVGYFVRPSP